MTPRWLRHLLRLNVVSVITEQSARARGGKLTRDTMMALCNVAKRTIGINPPQVRITIYDDRDEVYEWRDWYVFDRWNVVPPREVDAELIRMFYIETRAQVMRQLGIPAWVTP